MWAPDTAREWVGDQIVNVYTVLDGIARNGEYLHEPADGEEFHVRPGTADRLIIGEVYGMEPYPVHGNESVILDIGASIGAFTTYAANRAPEADIHAYEAEPHALRQLRKNRDRNDIDARIYEQVVAGTDGTETLHINERNEGGHSLYRFRHRGTTATTSEVPAVSLDTAVNDHCDSPVDLLKLDVEGAEYDILYGASADTLDRIDRIVGEFHPHPDHDIDELVAYLEENGFDVSVPGVLGRRVFHQGALEAKRGPR